MSELHLALAAASLSLACLAAGLLQRRPRSQRRDVRLLLGAGAGFGGVSLIVLSLA
jgi:hypothetical protein